MLVHLEKALDADQLARLKEMVAKERFVDGKGTAEGSAAAVKNNLQLPPESEATRAAGAYLLECLGAHPLFQLAAQPRALSPPLFSRYEAGMSYGIHLDAPVMYRGGILRTDVSVTVFLNDPGEYDGGELVIETATGEQCFKGAAGDCVLYPATTLHRVAEVTRGVRLVSAFWVQSMVRDASRREILYDFGFALEFLELTGGGGPYRERLRRCHVNLMRMWADV
jgi:PKHD-type hydroxylase